MLITEDEKLRIKSLYGLIKESNVLLEYPGQEIPITMNQIMQFQTWVWKNVDKLGNPDVADPNKLYKTSLCTSPCTVYNRRVNGKISTGAIDGGFGGNTIKLWNTYKGSYKKFNRSWDYDDSKTDSKVLGIDIPVTPLQTKNFQKWYLEKVEKFCNNYPDSPTFTQMGCKIGPDRTDRKFKTALCGGNRCTFETAVDGGGIENKESSTRKLWEVYKNQYKKDNPSWFEEKSWDLNVKYFEDKEKEENQKNINLNKLPKFWIDPSGWDGVKGRYNNNPAYSNINNTKYWKSSESDANVHYSDFAWSPLPNLYPTPRKYTLKEINSILPNGFEIDIDGNMVKKGQSWQDPNNTEAIAKKMIQFNKDLENQESDILNYCSPLRGFTAQSTQLNTFSKNSADVGGGGGSSHVDFWISSDNACLYAGGSWVYNFGGKKSCGCRDRTAPYLGITSLNEVNINGFITKSVTLPKITKIFNFKAENDFQWNEPTDYARIINAVVPYIAIPLAVFGGPLGLGVLELEAALLALDLVDAAAYMVNDDMYGAGLALTFGVIGAPKIMAKIPGIAEIAKRTGKTVGAIGAEIGSAINKGGDAIKPYLTAIDDIITNGTWLKTNFNNAVPGFKQKIKQKASKVAVKTVKVGLQTTKLVMKLFKLTLRAFLGFIIWLVNTKNLPVSFLRNFGINVGGSFLAWDVIAYFLGMCNTMPMAAVEVFYFDCEKLGSENPLSLNEEDKETLSSKPWLATVLLAHTMSSFQALTEPCQKIQSYIEMRDQLKKDEVKNDIKRGQEQVKSTKEWVLKQIETIKGNYTPLPDFDPQIYAIQLAIQHFLNNSPISGNVENITNWGELDKPTIIGIKQFQEYSQIDENGKIDKLFVDKMVKYLNLISGDIKNYGGIPLDDGTLKKLIEEAIKTAQSKTQPDTKQSSVVIDAENEWMAMPDNEKEKIIKDLEGYEIDDDGFEKYKESKGVSNL
jgi:hypothetical protein